MECHPGPSRPAENDVNRSRAGHEGDMHGHLTMPKARKVTKANGMKSKEHRANLKGLSLV